MTVRKLLPGKFVWFEHLSADPRRAQAFHGEVFGWKVEAFGGAGGYEMITVGDAMIGGYEASSAGPARWRSAVSVADVDAAAAAAVAGGGTLVEAPADAPGIGRLARIADPDGAELALFHNQIGDPPDGDAPVGGWVWNELHTPDPARALAFYARVVGFTHRSLDMGPAGAYHIISKDGVDRGGVTHHLPAGAPAHWLPYVRVDDPDATAARAARLGGAVRMGPEDIPGAGRAAVLADPTGATLAILRPMPRER